MPPAKQYDTWIENFYKIQAPIYDLTRWLFLFNRSGPASLAPPLRGGLAVELGCGTGYNFSSLRHMVGSGGEVVGVDISDAMLKRAARKIARHGWKNINLIRCSANRFFPLRAVDFVLCSYALSMVEAWQETINNAISYLNPGGLLGVVDFLPIASKRFPLGWIINRWLTLCHVYPSRNIPDYLKQISCPIHYRKMNWGYNFLYLGRKKTKSLSTVHEQS
jgi:ubiquinone/menaquinone biosynthesis C-methylase UbiE